MFGMSAKRIAFYGLAIVALLGLNYWRLATTDTASDTAKLSDRTVIQELPELYWSTPANNEPRQSNRDIFRIGKAEEPAPPPPPREPEAKPEPKPAPPDPRALAIQRFNNQLNAVDVVGLIGNSDAMVAVVENNGKVINVSVGQLLIPGLVVSEISGDGVLVRNDQYDFERLIEIGNGTR